MIDAAWKVDQWQKCLPERTFHKIKAFCKREDSLLFCCDSSSPVINFNAECHLSSRISSPTEEVIYCFQPMFSFILLAEKTSNERQIYSITVDHELGLECFTLNTFLLLPYML